MKKREENDCERRREKLREREKILKEREEENERERRRERKREKRLDESGDPLCSLLDVKNKRKDIEER